MAMKNYAIMLGAVSVIAIMMVAGFAGPNSAEAKSNVVEKVYSPTILNALAGVLNDASTRTYTYGNHTTIEITTTVKSEGNTHKITYETYVNGTKDSDLTTKVKVRVESDTLYWLQTPDFTGYIAGENTRDVTRSVTLRDSTSCAATPTITGHGYISSPVAGCGFNFSSGAYIQISSTSGKLGWSTAASVHIWGVQYAYEQTRLNPQFATSTSYYSNALGGSLTYSGIYSASDSYYGRATFYYQN